VSFGVATSALLAGVVHKASRHMSAAAIFMFGIVVDFTFYAVDWDASGDGTFENGRKTA